MLVAGKREKVEKVRPFLSVETGDDIHDSNSHSVGKS